MFESRILFRGTPGQFADIARHMEGRMQDIFSDPALRVTCKPIESAQLVTANVVTVAFQTSVDTGVESRDIGGADFANYAAQQLGKPALIYEHGRLTAVAAPDSNSHLEMGKAHSRRFPAMLRFLLADLAERGYVRSAVLVAYRLPRNESLNDDYAFRFGFSIMDASPGLPSDQFDTVCSVRVEMEWKLAFNWNLTNEIGFEVTESVLDVARQAAVASLRREIATGAPLPKELPLIKMQMANSPRECPYRINRAPSYHHGDLIMMLERGVAFTPSGGLPDTTNGGVTIISGTTIVEGDVTGRDKLVSANRPDVDKSTD